MHSSLVFIFLETLREELLDSLLVHWSSKVLAIDLLILTHYLMSMVHGLSEHHAVLHSHLLCKLLSGKDLVSSILLLNDLLHEGLLSSALCPLLFLKILLVVHHFEHVIFSFSGH